MKIIIFLSISALSFSAVASSSHEMFINGCQAYVSRYSLKTKPVDKKDLLPIGYCLGLVDGVSKSIYHYNDKAICFPDDSLPSIKDLVSVVMTYVHKDPEKINKLSAMSVYSTSDLVSLALMEKYPCKKF